MEWFDFFVKEVQKVFPNLKKIHFYIASVIFFLSILILYNIWIFPPKNAGYMEKLLFFFTRSQDSFRLRLPLNIRFWRWQHITYSFLFSFSYLFYVALKPAPKKLRDGKEYGSARWGTSKDLEGFTDAEAPFNNVILSETEKLTMNPRQQPWYKQRNKNIVVVGGSGAGKTRYFIKPNLMQMHSSFVVTDPKGTILSEVGNMLLRGSYKVKRKELTEAELQKGQVLGREVYENNTIVYEKDNQGRLILEPYKIKVLNLINFLKSMKYNPFRYVRSEKDILTFVNVIMANTNSSDSKSSGDDFWVKSERLLFMALISYIRETLNSKEQNFTSLLTLLNCFEVREQDEKFRNVVDRLFEDLEKENESSFAVLQYKKFKLAAGKTAKSILISCASRLAPFDIPEVRELLEDDELEIDKLGEEKTALFVIIPDSDSTFNFIAALLYTQMFNLLITKADDVYDGLLPNQIRFLGDEFANIGLIPNFDKLIATIRSRGISASIIFQTESQCKAIYKDNAETILGNCDSYIFLGGKEGSTIKNLNEFLGKETIDTITTGRSYSMQQSASTNFARTGRELMTKDEIATMERDKCIVSISGLYPFFSQKYKLENHPNYKYLAGEANSKVPLLDVEQYVQNQRKEKLKQKGEVVIEDKGGETYEFVVNVDIE